MKLAAAIVAIAIVAAAIFFLRAPKVSVAKVERGTAIDAVYATGTVEAIDRVEVRARASGTLIELKVHEGDAVHKGDLLARIDAKALSTEMARGKVEYDAARERSEGAPQLEMFGAQAKGLEAEIALAKSDVKRVEELVKSGVQPPQELEKQRAHLSSLQAQLEANKAQQRDVRLALDADAARARAGMATLSARASDAEVRSPMDGVVLVRRVEQGETVVLNQPLFKVGDLSRLRLEAQVDEADVGQLRQGTPALLRLPAFQDQLLHAHVAKIAPESDRERKSFEVDLDLESPPASLRPGMTAEVNLLARRHDGVLLAPAQSVRSGALFVVSKGHIEKRQVQIGIRDLSRVEVSGEVAEGDLAVLGDAAPEEGARASPHLEKLPQLHMQQLRSEPGLTER